MIEKSKVLEAAKLLNDSKLAEKKVKTVATSVEALKEDFMAAVETISEKDEKKIPKAVAKMYNDLVEESEEVVDENTDDADDEVAAEEEEEVVEKKGKGKKAKPEPEDDEDDEDEKPKAKVKNKKVKEEEEEEEKEDEDEEEKPKKKTKKVEPKVAPKKKEGKGNGKVEVTVFGGRASSMAGSIEIILLENKEGVSLKKIINELMKKFSDKDKNEAYFTRYINGHIKNLKKKGGKITEKEGKFLTKA